MFLMKRPTPIENRPYRYKKAALRFFCPLCATERAITTHPHVTRKNHLQFLLATVLISMPLYQQMQGFVVVFYFMIWGAFEAIIRAKFRKEVPCPHCGFDASWYKRDVKVTRERVKNFWQDKTQKLNFPQT
jgi:hypothetical protein